MTFFDIIMVNLILITFPIFVWLFYTTYSKNMGKKENELFLDFAIFTMLYLLVKYAPTFFADHPLLIVNLPLILAYLKKRHISGVVISLILIIYYNFYFNVNIILLILEYSICYILFILWLKIKFNRYYLLVSIIVIKSLAFILWIISSNYFGKVNQEVLSKTLFLILLLSAGSFIALRLCSRGMETLKYHLTLKELEQEKQIRTSLFKITHEIKNPIAVCKGYLDMFDVKNINHSKKYIPVIKEEIERTLLLLQDFLCMTKIQINKEVIDINMVLEDVVDNFIPILKQKNIMADFRIPEESTFMYGDYNRLSQTFINIIKNSVEAIDPAKRSMIKLYTKTYKKHIKISIIDNGLGISKENIKKISEPFFTTKCNGTGLGVSLSYEIIAAHNGQIKYASEEGIGTSVEIILPINKNKRM